MYRLKVPFTESEYWALLRRIAVDLNDKIEYQEFVYACLPNEMYNYSSYRANYSKEDGINDIILNKAKEFDYVHPEELFEFDKLDRPLTHYYSKNKNYTKFYSFRKVYDPINNGRNNYVYDKSYHKDFHNYKARFVEPSKNLLFKYNENNQSIKTHDHYYNDYYLFLYDREKSEEFFNKYGKRYEYTTESEYDKKVELDMNEKKKLEILRLELRETKH